MMPPPDAFPMGSHTPRSEPFMMGGHAQPPPPRDLHQRFARPQTSMGHRPPPPVDYDDRDHDRELDFDRNRDRDRDRYEDSLSSSMRRLSMGYKPRYDEPNRAMSARPQASPFMPPPALPPARERSTHRGVDRGMERLMDRPYREREREHRQYDDHFEEPDSTYYESSVPYDDPPLRVPRHRRESIEPPQYSYESSRPYATDIARTTGNRRDSYYGESQSSSAFEDKMRLASSYQEDKGGMPLTAHLLHESERDRHGPRSRSTRSSGSRDESDWRTSATTRTTRTTHNEDDDLYIRMRNGKVVEMHYEPSVFGAIEDERQSRYDRPALRSRAASRAGSIYAPPAGEIEYSYGGGDYSDESPFAPREHNRYIRDH